MGRTLDPWPEESSTEIDEIRSGAELAVRGAPVELTVVGNWREVLAGAGGDQAGSSS
jgi:hypothetical protein